MRRYRKSADMTQAQVAAGLSRALGKPITQSKVSDNEKGSQWSDPDLPGAYVKVLHIPQAEMLKVLGFATTAKVPRSVTFADVVRADPTLSATAKRHLLAQHKLLQLASRTVADPGDIKVGTDAYRRGQDAGIDDTPTEGVTRAKRSR